MLRLLAAPVSAHADAVTRTAGNVPPGAALESVLSIARQLSPELALRALDTQAAQARADATGSLPDPKFQVMSDEIDRTSGPRQNKMIYSFEQDFPLWGKRDLRRDAAQAEVSQAAARLRNAEAELAEKVKVAFARYYTAFEAVHRTEDLHRAIHGIARAAEDCYAQGGGSQPEVIKAEVENTRLATEIVRLETALRSAEGQLNALLLRPMNAPLAAPERLRPLPDSPVLNPARLAAQARSANPALAESAAAVSGAQSNRRLAERNWYPDITLGAGAIDRGSNGPPGYQAWVAVRVPLQWGLHDAQAREASAQAAAANNRRAALDQQIQGELAQAVAELEGSRRIATLIRRQLLPQAEALVRSGTTGYAYGKVDLATVLQAQHDLADLHLQLLSTEFDGQRQLAAVERLTGGDL